MTDKRHSPEFIEYKQELKEITSDNIRRLIKMHRMSHREYAEFVGLYRTSISKYATALKCPDTFTLKKIADAEGITIDYLVTDHRNNNNKS